jgi:hypothetical protein
MQTTGKLGKNLHLRSQKARTEHMTLRETIMTPEVTIQAEAVAEAETTIDLCIAYFMRETPNIRQGIVASSWNPRRK